jgi:cytochrome b6-f complex iron-sulfur subunit
MKKEDQVTRRTFLNRAWKMVVALIAAEFAWMGVSFLNSRKAKPLMDKSKQVVTAGPVDRFRPGTVTAISRGPFYLACLTDGSFLALSRTCTHLGCAIPWVEEKKQFICPCHGSRFNLTGEVLTAPAPRALDTYPVRIENGFVKVDMGSPRRRERFNPSQATSL